MLIHVPCPCGRSLKVKEELAGRKVRCPECREVVIVPQAQNQNADDEALAILLTDAPAEPRSPARLREPEDAPEDQQSPSSPPAKPGRPKPARLQPGEVKKSPKRPRQSKSEWSLPSIAVHPQIISGLLMMLGAAIWFFVGLAAGRFFIYPPILFVLGIAAVIRGFTGED